MESQKNIFKYLDGELTPDEQQAFEAEMAKDAALQDKVARERAVMACAASPEQPQSAALHKQAERISDKWLEKTSTTTLQPQKSGISFWKILGAVSGAMISAFFWFKDCQNNPSPQQTPVVTPNIPTVAFPNPAIQKATVAPSIQAQLRDSVLRIPVKNLVAESKLAERIGKSIQLNNNSNIQKIVKQYYTSNLSAQISQAQPAAVATFWLLKATQLFEQRGKPTEIKAALARIPPSFFESEKAFYQAALSESSPSLDLLLSQMTKEDIFYEKAITLDSSLHK